MSTPIPNMEPLKVQHDRVTGHYGVYCDVCAAPVEYADLTTHKCVVEAQRTDSSWDYTLPGEYQDDQTPKPPSHVVCVICDDSVPVEKAISLLGGARWSCRDHITPRTECDHWYNHDGRCYWCGKTQEVSL